MYMYIYIYIYYVYVYNVSATTSNNMYEGLRMDILCNMFFHQITYIITEGFLICHPLQTIRRPLSARKPGSGRTRHLRQEPFHDFLGVCWKLESFYQQNICSGQVRTKFLKKKRNVYRTRKLWNQTQRHQNLL